ncbi:MAG TPA: hypothetical protein VMR54_15790 [Thermoanaerobaculia bacterium]|nr:hypothetical protein [Thermoanaerobaculia bacterium]
MKTRTLSNLLAAALLAAIPTPARAWVAAGGYHGGVVAVGYRPPCCYSGAAVAGAAIGGAMVGAAVASAAQPAYVAPAPVYYSAPVAYAPAVGTVVSALPPTGCSSLSINGISYMNCAGVFYMPFYSGGALMYQVAQP